MGNNPDQFSILLDAVMAPISSFFVVVLSQSRKALNSS